MMGIAIYQFNANLLGESKFNIRTSRGSQLDVTFLNRYNDLFDFWDSDTFGADNIFTGNTGKGDGFLNANLDGFGVGNHDREIDGGDDGNIVLGGLSNLFAVFAVSTISAEPVASIATVCRVTVAAVVARIEPWPARKRTVMSIEQGF